jgi:putative SOS response-associated peptidase YedK
MMMSFREAGESHANRRQRRLLSRAQLIDCHSIPAHLAVRSSTAISRSPFVEIAGHETIRSFTIVTTEPNEICGELHDRMSVVLPPDTWSVWLGEDLPSPNS